MGPRRTRRAISVRSSAARTVSAAPDRGALRPPYRIVSCSHGHDDTGPLINKCPDTHPARAHVRHVTSARRTHLGKRVDEIGGSLYFHFRRRGLLSAEISFNHRRMNSTSALEETSLSQGAPRTPSPAARLLGSESPTEGRRITLPPAASSASAFSTLPPGAACALRVVPGPAYLRTGFTERSPKHPRTSVLPQHRYPRAPCREGPAGDPYGCFTLLRRDIPALVALPGSRRGSPLILADANAEKAAQGP